MEPLAVIGYVNEVIPQTSFMLVDVGCSRGLDPQWRLFGSRFRALAFDPVVDEIERLRRENAYPGVEYIAAFATINEDHPFAIKKGEREHWSRNPWNRLSVTKWLEKTASERVGMDSGDLASSGLWQETRLVEPTRAVVIPAYIRQVGLESVDFLKIDIDGKDLEVLHSFESSFDEFRILGLAVEVNFFGSDSETDHTFHNTDRFLKSKGFELFDLTLRRYSLATLPSRYILDQPGETEFGRPLQGDALYLRDLGNPIYADFARGIGIEKLLNLICLFALFKLPDCAAEVALVFKEQLKPICNVDHLLDLLAVEAQKTSNIQLSYEEYLARFDARDRMFLRSPQTTEDVKQFCGDRKGLLHFVLRSIFGTKAWAK
jgi:FkbM family methyltransferase